MPGNKDTGGWSGPATVVDASHPGHGTITIRHLNHAFERRFRDVRPPLTFAVFLAAPHSALGVYARGLQKIRQIAENLNKGQCLHLGKVMQNGVWTKTKQNSTHTDAYSTAKHIAEQSLGRKHIVAVRIAFGCAKLGALPNYNEALTLWWTSPNDITNEITYDNCNNEIPAINFQQLVPDKWTYTRAIQFLSANTNHMDEDTPTVGVDRDSHGGSRMAKTSDIPTPLPTPGGSLTPITEEPSDGEFEEWDTYLVADLEADTDVNEAYRKARTDLYHIFGEENLMEAEDEESEEMQRLSDALTEFAQQELQQTTEET